MHVQGPFSWVALAPEEITIATSSVSLVEQTTVFERRQYTLVRPDGGA